MSTQVKESRKEKTQEIPSEFSKNFSKNVTKFISWIFKTYTVKNLYNGKEASPEDINLFNFVEPKRKKLESFYKFIIQSEFMVFDNNVSITDENKVIDDFNNNTKKEVKKPQKEVKKVKIKENLEVKKNKGKKEVKKTQKEVKKTQKEVEIKEPLEEVEIKEPQKEVEIKENPSFKEDILFLLSRNIIKDGSYKWEMKIDNKIINIENNNDFEQCTILLEKLYNLNFKEKEEDLFGEESDNETSFVKSNSLENTNTMLSNDTSFEDEINLDDIEF